MAGGLKLPRINALNETTKAAEKTDTVDIDRTTYDFARLIEADAVGAVRRTGAESLKYVVIGKHKSEFIELLREIRHLPEGKMAAAIERWCELILEGWHPSTIMRSIRSGKDRPRTSLGKH